MKKFISTILGIIICINVIAQKGNSAPNSDPASFEIAVDPISSYFTNQSFTFSIQLLETAYVLNDLEFDLELGHAQNANNDFRWTAEELGLVLSTVQPVNSTGTVHFFTNINVIPYNTDSPDEPDHQFRVHIDINHYDNGVSASGMVPIGPGGSIGKGLISVDIDGNESDDEDDGCGDVIGSMGNIILNGTTPTIGSFPSLEDGDDCPPSTGRLNSLSDQMIISPNPATDHFSISNAENIETVLLINSNGVTSRIPLEEGETLITVTHLPNGLYTVRVALIDGSVVSHKLILID